MNRFFAADSKPMLFLSRLFDVIILSGLFLLCSIPVITIGPALSALYFTTGKVVRKRKGYLVRTFFHSLRINLLQGMIVWLLLLFVTILMVVNIWYSATYFQGVFQVAMMAVYFAILILAVILTGYVFPILSRFECRGKQVFSNAVSIGVAHPLESIGLLVLQIGFYVLLTLSSVVFPLLLFFLPVIYAMVSQYILERIFLQYMETDQDSQEEEPI